jgi:hypothetical protein
MYREVKDLIAGGGEQHHSAVVSEGIRTSTSPDPEADSLDSPPSSTSGKSGKQTSFAPTIATTSSGTERKGVAGGGGSQRSAAVTSTPTNGTNVNAGVAVATTAATGAAAAAAAKKGVIASGGRKGLEQARRSAEGLPAGAAAAIAAGAANNSNAVAAGTRPSKQQMNSLGTSSSVGALLDPNNLQGGLLVPTAMPVITNSGSGSSSVTSSPASAQAQQAQAAAAARAGVITSSPVSHVIGGPSHHAHALASPATPATGPSSSSSASLALNAPQSPLKAAVVERMKAEKRQLQIKLNRFEQTFRQLKGRPIKYAKDIAPVRAGTLYNTCAR